ncbi:Retinal pigment epithelial membrane protein [seawater metagenome]|uniref:Retinal pigment epithelial membrane protein n=1 Tax=seawater metagenome TaxID=1561972 RepID=A0A5E8CHU2_9ZZZZ
MKNNRWSSAFQNVEVELELNIESKNIIGEIPSNLNGTLYRIGPAFFGYNQELVNHWFDGDGMVVSINIKDKKVFFRNKFVKTKGYLEEKKEKKSLYRGVFGSKKTDSSLKNFWKLKNVSNTNIFFFNNKLLSLWEAGLPYHLDALSLETLSIENFNNQLNESDFFSAHPKYDPFNQKIITFSSKPGMIKSILKIMEIDSNNIINSYSIDLKGFLFVHDFAITKEYYIFYQAPISFNPVPYIIGLKGVGQCIKKKEMKIGTFVLINKITNKITSIPGNNEFIFHHVNAYQKDKNIYIDSVYYSDLEILNMEFNDPKPLKNKPMLKRCILNIESKKSTFDNYTNDAMEFGTVHPNYYGKLNKYIWLACLNNKNQEYFNCIRRINISSYKIKDCNFSENHYIGEPIFVSKNNNNELAGFILTMVWDGENKISYLSIIDAEEMIEICKIILPIIIPHQIHGFWHCF